MKRSLKSMRDKSFLPLVSNRRCVFKIIFINCLVMIVFGAAALNYNRDQVPSLVGTPSQYNQNNTRRPTKVTDTGGPTSDPTALFSIPPVPKRSSSDFVPSLQRSIMNTYLRYESRVHKDSVVILTPIHDVARLLPKFGKLLKTLTYPHNLISVAFGEDCSHDGTLTAARQVADDLRTTFRNVDILHFNITGGVSGQWIDIHRKQRQQERRGHLAKARNMLMKAALKNSTWALWIDSDITYLPPDIIQQLMSSDKDIVVPACLFNSNRRLRVFDKNTWRETLGSLAFQKTMGKNELMLEGYGISRRLFLTDLRAEGRVVPIDGVGGCTLLIKGDYHRNGLIFPETVLNHHIETEGLGKLAKIMGYGVYGMPFVEVLH